MRIGLGTAQFGLDYGITNRTGRVARDDAAAILALAERSGIDTIDTAPLYGDSEAALGAAGTAAFRIVTKTPKFGAASSPEQAAEQLRESFDHSLAKLCRPRVHALLIHDPDDLTGPFGDRLWKAMEALKTSGLVSEIGLSVYEGAEIDAVLERYPVDIVQLPWNPLDQRLEAGSQLARLAEAGVEVHARSLFLQGLLLEEPSRIPAKFAPIAEAVAQMRSVFDHSGLTALEGILSLAFQQTNIDRFICGVTGVHELGDIITAAQKAQKMGPISTALPLNLDPRLLNPSRWEELGA